MSDVLDQEIKYLPGVGPKRAELLKKELDISTFRDLMYYFPYKYIDRTRFYKIRELDLHQPYVQTKGKIRSFNLIGEGRKQRLTAEFYDDTGSIELIWFSGIRYIRQNIIPGKEYTVFGKPSSFNGKINIVHPEMESEKTEVIYTGILQSFYNTSGLLKKRYITSRTLNKLQYILAKSTKDKINETLPSYILDKFHLLNLAKSLKEIHFPENSRILQKATFRLKFEELFYIQLKILLLKIKRQNHFKGFVFSKVGDNFNRFYNNNLPFELTNAQKKVIKEIRHDLGSGKQMNRLLQGDVGSGKTLVALMVSLIAFDNGYQVSLMAPTEILAQQHFQTIKKFLKGIPINIGLLTGSVKSKKRRETLEGIKTGEIQILIGTHALIEDTVVFKNLGLVIIDEQHRFGVAQRGKLWTKSDTIPPHILVMTATPIPRTLAMTIYGDLDVSVIDELPPGRKPIETRHSYDNRAKDIYQFIKKQIKQGRQAYIVYPLIKESEKSDLKNIENGYEFLKEVFPMFTLGMVHGKMKAAEKEKEMQLFKEGKSQILVATTVIEVGVDVPNATIMVIQNAERFGLSQLHQLRGRVGRGGSQSYCILMSSFKISNLSRKRLDTMVRTNDGFEIAEADLKLRGPGDMEGTQQSGLGVNLHIANIAKDGKILQVARDTASEILEKDPGLKKDENKILRSQLVKIRKNEFNWSVIS